MNAYQIPTATAGQVHPEIGMVIVVKGKRYQVAGFNRTTINVLGADGKTYRLSLRGSALVQPDADQSWTIAAPVLPRLGVGQVVRFGDAREAAKYPGLYVVIKTAEQTVKVALLGGDPVHPDLYVRASPSLLIAVTGTL